MGYLIIGASYFAGNAKTGLVGHQILQQSAGNAPLRNSGERFL